MRSYEQRLKETVQKAEAAFWEVVATEYGETETADFPPTSDDAFKAACREAVEAWITWNVYDVEDSVRRRDAFDE